MYKLTSADSERLIVVAWLAGLLHSLLAFRGALSLSEQLDSLGFSGIGVLAFPSVVFLFFLTWGIYKRSRFCAVVMLIYFIYKYAPLAKPGTFWVIVLFTFLYSCGVVGAFVYRRLNNRII